MKIHGLQKMTLLDFPGRVACTVFLGGCDFRCPFCHNFELADGTAQPVMDDEELLAFLKKRRGLLDGVAFTGGEPLLYRELPELLRKIRELGFAVKLDTNGAHPALLRQILEEGLADYVAMDIKNSPAKYAVTCGVERLDMDAIRESISLLMNGVTDYEFRTTVVAEFHEAADFEEMGKLIAGAKRYFLQCFTDRDTVPFEGLHAPSAEQLQEYARIASGYVGDVQLRGVDL
ncbi:MAG: anaerobic ribonucleoside-triphosphate reductase activating protein [Lachnospiraceae bacterium]|nr:anaerobic ribonucleoside-triphosphate reductase activating protein [Lachnospiraceae bacterium]